MQKPEKENPYHSVMPPLIGTEEEVRALSAYLYDSIQVIEKKAKGTKVDKASVEN